MSILVIIMVSLFAGWTLRGLYSMYRNRNQDTVYIGKSMAELLLKKNS